MNPRIEILRRKVEALAAIVELPALAEQNVCLHMLSDDERRPCLCLYDVPSAFAAIGAEGWTVQGADLMKVFGGVEVSLYQAAALAKAFCYNPTEEA